MKYKYDAFISYSSKDSKTANSLAKTMGHLGLDVFLSESNLEPKIGENFLTEISKALESSKHFILIASSSSLNSPWVQLEYSNFINVCYAKKPKKRKIIILKKKKLDIDEVPLILRSFQISTSKKLIAHFVFDNKAKNINRKSIVDQSKVDNYVRELLPNIKDEEFLYIGVDKIFDKDFKNELGIPRSNSRASLVRKFIDKKLSVNHKKKHLKGSDHSFVILLVKGESPDEEPIYAYVMVKTDKIEAFMEAQKEGVFYPEDYGQIIVSGEGIPSQKVRREMEQKFGYDHRNEFFL